MPITLLTGAPGWLGTRLCQALLDNTLDSAPRADLADRRRVRCLVIPGQDVSALRTSQQVEIVEGDVRNPDSLRAFYEDSAGATLFHCAGIVHPKRFRREFFEINVSGTRNLLEAAEAARVRRVIAVSSNSPFGANPRRDHRFDESSPYKPYMGYGRSKMMMERVVNEYQQRGKMETVIIRPVWFYGPYQPERQTAFFHMIKSGTVPIVGDGENLRSMVYIDNLCQALLLSEQAAIANGQSYWVADRRPYCMNEIVDTVERLMEDEFGLRVAHRRMRLPFLTSEVAGVVDGLIQGLGLYQQRIHVLSEMNKTIACSIEKAQTELGYNPTVDLEEGMRRSLAWCLAEGIEL